MTDFDPVKAQREQVAGMAQMFKNCHTRARETEKQLAEAESEHETALKMEAFAKDLLEQMTAKLRALEDAAERKAKGEV